MILADFLPLLGSTHQKGSRWGARCPAHEDRSPSLSVAEGDDGRILLHCFVGCTVDEICSALGIRTRELFTDRCADPERVREARSNRDRERAARQHESRINGLRIDRLREAELLISAARDIDIGGWTDARLQTALDRLADAHNLIFQEGCYE